MSLQRTGYGITAHENEEEGKSAVVMIVYVDGKLEDRGDQLLMIVDAWAHAMTELGLDPDASFMKMRREGSLQ